MKLLFLANRIPYPPYRGDKLKIYNLAKRLSVKHELYLLTFTEKATDLQYKADLEKLFKEVHFIHLPKWRSALNCIQALWKKAPLQVLYFQSREMQSALDMLLTRHGFDAIHVQHLRMSPYLAQRKELPRVLDLPDAFSLYWKRRQEIRSNPVQKLLEQFEQKRLESFEQVVNDFPVSLVCSPEDQEYLEQRYPDANIQLLPNGVDLDTFRVMEHNYDHNHTILFTGNMDYAPNVDAVIHFAEDILPLIHHRFPQTRFIIAGQRPVSKVTGLASDTIKITGFVKDLAAVYNDASVVVAPLRFGAGTQNKVLEAMAMGVPVVCSHVGFKGLGIENGQGAIMQTDNDAFADEVCKLLASADYRRTVGSQGVQVIRERFDWDKIACQLEQYFKQVQIS